MIYSESSVARRIFGEFLPPWASRVGYVEGVPEPESLVPPHIFPIPLNVAPASTLDGIWIDSAHAPVTVQDLANNLASLGPGGVGVLFLSSRFWRRAQLKRFCRGAGMQILFFSPVPSKGRVRLNRRGLPVPRSIVRRFLLRAATMFFPGLTFLFGSEWFVILQKGVGRSRESDGVRLSVILPLPADRDRARRRLREWESFLSQHRMHDIQLVAVDESGGDPLEGVSGSTLRVHHYRSFGRSQAIRSGLLNARGKSILIDSDRFLPPPLLFDLLSERFKETSAADVLSGYDVRRQPFVWSRMLYRAITGLTRPDPLYMLISDRAARSILDLHPGQLGGYAYALPLHLRRAGLKIREVPLYPDPPSPPSPVPPPSLFSYLRFRLRRGAVYLAVLLWLPFLPPILQSGIISAGELAESIRPSVESCSQSAVSVVTVAWAAGEESRAYLAGLIMPVVQGMPADLMRGTAGWLWQMVETTRLSGKAVISGPVVSSVLDPSGPVRSGFFFVLGMALLLHFYNSVIVFRLSSGRIFAFLAALCEAGLLLFVLKILEPSRNSLFGPFASPSLPGQAFPFAGALLIARLTFYPVYSVVFRRRKGRSAM